MTEERHDRRSVLELSGSALAALGGVSLVGTAAANEPCPECGDDGDDGGGGGGGGSLPSVSTRFADVSGSSATLNGRLDSVGGDDSADVWFEWGPEGDGLPYDTPPLTRSGLTFYSDTASNSLDGGTYEFRAAASNDWGKTEGYVQTFDV
ncbi:hypothetical protein [Halorussus halobius]|uniref:hypothetical protein n=1 Tax=Halorussus halobius TaxID=1710537 RepID=UPI0010930E6C|nr:hypothetical protein [Halorussus halobius]